jgi:hypothetical protein
VCMGENLPIEARAALVTLREILFSIRNRAE